MSESFSGSSRSQVSARSSWLFGGMRGTGLVRTLRSRLWLIHAGWLNEGDV